MGASLTLRSPCRQLPAGVGFVHGHSLEYRDCK